MVPIAVSAKIYGLFYTSLANKEMNLASDTLKCLLCTSSYTPNQDTHRYKSDLTNEVTGTGYTAGGVALTGVTLSYDTASNTFKLDANDPAWASSTITAAYAVFYDSTPSTDATRPLICYVDLGGNISSTASTFTVQLDANGIINLTAA